MYQCRSNCFLFFFSSRRRHTILQGDWSSDVCSSDLIAIPGFYDKVRDWGQDARHQIKSLPFEDETFRHETGSPDLFGEKGYSTLERVWMRSEERRVGKECRSRWSPYH